MSKNGSFTLNCPNATYFPMNWHIFRLFWVFFLLSAPWAHSATIISGPIISDTIWTETESPYVVSDILVASGVTLTLEPGVVVKMGHVSARFEVNGTLIANGTPDKKIYFTSAVDDEIGGDANNDGSATAPRPGDWVHVVFNPGSTGEFANTVFRYAGSFYSWQYSLCAIYNLGGTISITGSEFYKNAHCGLRQINGSSKINYSDFHNQGISVKLDGGSTEISNSNIHNLAGEALEANNGNLSLINNNFYDNAVSAGFIDGKVNFIHSQNDASGNLMNGFTIFNVLDHDQTWNEDLPYLILGFSVGVGKKLTIEPGVVVKPRGSDQIYVRGELQAIGAVDKKIYFTSFLDDEVGGDTNNDGSATLPQSGDWMHVYFAPGSVGDISNTVVRYAGSSYGWNPSGAGIANEGGNVSVADSEITNNFRHGVLNLFGSLLLNNTEINDHREVGAKINGGSVTISDNIFINNHEAVRINLSDVVSFTHSNNVALGPGFNGLMVQGFIIRDQVWTKDLPYITDPITVIAGKTLTIEAGVVIKNPHFNIFGFLDARGTDQEKIYFTSEHDDEVGGDTNGNGSSTFPVPGQWGSIKINPGAEANFKYSIIRYGGANVCCTGPIMISNSGLLTISDSEVASSTNYGIHNNAGEVNISHSYIHANQYGLYNSGGIMSVEQSSISGNSVYGAYNNSISSIFAENNWWGDASGPYHPTLNPTGNVESSVSNNVDFDPWLGADPLVAPLPLPTCCSNVLFLPGLEASRLYLEDGTQIWTPPLDHDNSRLFLNPDGSSIKPNIYTKDILDEVYGANIYKSFIAEMNGLVSEGIINHWKPYPYDWRKNINDIVNGYTRLDGGLAMLTENLEFLAENSQTGKVNIISHSNGGLIGKMLINKLVAEGKEDLVDKFIMVASPQLGTPKAIAMLLHGEGMPVKLPFVMTAATSRILAENMPSGYTLLPPNEYFARVLDPVIEFDPASTLAQPFINTYGLAVTNGTELREFLLGADGRADPDSSDTMAPNILNTALLDRGIADHIALDSWQSPSNIETIQIVGWGIPTLRGIKYADKHKFNCLINCTFLDHEPIMTSDGDETVVVPSAEATNVQTYYVNLKKYNSLLNLRRNRNHGNILEVSDLLGVFENIIKDEQISFSSIIRQTKPTSDSSDNSTLRLKVHSPVSLDIYDSLGRHTGVSTTTSFFPDRFLDEQIPNSYYIEMGEGKYAGADIFGTTTIKLVGQDFGVFTLDIEKVNGDSVFATSTFKDIPVAEGSVAFYEESAGGNNTSLMLDVDGDGLVDVNILPGEGLSAEELIGILRGFIKNLHLPTKKELQILKKIEKLEKIMEKEFKSEIKKKNKTKQAVNNILETIKKFEKKRLLTPDETSELADIIGRIQGAVVE